MDPDDRLRYAWFGSLLLCAGWMLVAAPKPLGAFERQDTAAIQRAVEAFLRRETAGLPGEVSHAVGAIDTRLNVAMCPVPEVFLPAGARLWGKTSVGVRCGGANPWLIYVSVTVRVNGRYLVTVRPLGQGQVVTSEDVTVKIGDLGQLPGGILADPNQAIGKTVAIGVAAGQPLRQDSLRAPLVVQQGQSVKLVATGPGFQVSFEGRALNNAADGQPVQVRVVSGQVVRGIARNGSTVEVAY